MTEARIGTLAWFAGVWWLSLATLAHGGAWALFRIGDERRFRFAWRGTWVLLRVADACNELVFDCAKDGGYKP